MKVTKVSPVQPIAKGFLNDKYTSDRHLFKNQAKSFKEALEKELRHQSKVDINI